MFDTGTKPYTVTYLYQQMINRISGSYLRAGLTDTYLNIYLTSRVKQFYLRCFKLVHKSNRAI